MTWAQVMKASPLDVGDAIVGTYESRNFLSLARTSETEWKHRFLQVADEWSLRTWKLGQETYMTQPIDRMPEWLREIVNVAIIGEHCMHPKDPPGSILVWFTTDNNLNLTNIEPRWSIENE
jgi:hypothetical protein